MTKIGHNGFDAGRLASIVERLEKLESDKADIAADIKDVYSEAKGAGYDVPTIKKVLKIKKMEPQEREEQETILDAYLHALQLELFDKPE